MPLQVELKISIPCVLQMALCCDNWVWFLCGAASVVHPGKDRLANEQQRALEKRGLCVQYGWVNTAITRWCTADIIKGEQVVSKISFYFEWKWNLQPKGIYFSLFRCPVFLIEFKRLFIWEFFSFIFSFFFFCQVFPHLNRGSKDSGCRSLYRL